MLFSLIIPVFNRPEEINELLESLCTQTVNRHTFEVIVVEDGSQIACKDVCERYNSLLNLHYYSKENSGPGMSRNYGADKAQGDYLIILDSDVVLPENYLKKVSEELERQPADAFGGADRAHPSFTPTQKAISYSMTSFFTTGGIRGGRKKLDKFYPRSFNMGIRKDVYRQLGGFSRMRFGEDIDFSIRIFDAGFRCRLFPEAWVWHKRRTDFRKFFRQVYNSGIARINLHKKHPGSLKAVHLLPALFTLGTIGLGLLSLLLWSVAPLALLAAYILLLFIDASCRNGSIKIGFLSIIAAFVQLMGYGFGFIEAWWKRCVRGLDEFQAFEKNFYK